VTVVTLELDRAGINVCRTGLSLTAAQEARAAMNAPDEEEEAPDIDSIFAKLKDLKRTDVPSG
jgi:hypothetical protein